MSDIINSGSEEIIALVEDALSVGLTGDAGFKARGAPAGWWVLGLVSARSGQREGPTALRCRRRRSTHHSITRVAAAQMTLKRHDLRKNVIGRAWKTTRLQARLQPLLLFP